MEIDRKTLKALAADTRLDILKSLGSRRKMPSELSKELNLATSTVVEHLNRLEEADLVKREETGHKWIYYSLTEKGGSLIKPRVPIQFVIVLGVCILAISIGFFYVNYANNYQTFASSKGSPTVPTVSQGVESARNLGTTAEIANTTNSTNSTNVTNTTIVSP